MFSQELTCRKETKCEIWQPQHHRWRSKSLTMEFSSMEFSFLNYPGQEFFFSSPLFNLHCKETTQKREQKIFNPIPRKLKSQKKRWTGACPQYVLKALAHKPTEKEMTKKKLNRRQYSNMENHWLVFLDVSQEHDPKKHNSSFVLPIHEYS